MEVDLLKNGIHSRSELERICRVLSPSLNFEGDKFSLLMALSGNETSFGLFNVPKFEYGYSQMSVAYKRSDILKNGYLLYGDHCAMSYGTHQIMWVVARELGYPETSHPLNLTDAEVSIPYVIKQINRLVRNGARLIEEVGICYNGGLGALKAPNADHMKYAKKLRNYYEQLLAQKPQVMNP